VTHRALEEAGRRRPDGPAAGGVLDEALAPLDRDVFRRQVRYDAQTVARTPPRPREPRPAAPPAAPPK
jgi:hypothetical protein